MSSGTRDRIVTEAMRLFGENGFAGTSIAQIEAAAGLTPGSGGLYRHFPSKEALLSTGIRERIESRNELLPSMSPSSDAPTEAVLLKVAQLGLQRLDDERDVNRILVRDLASAPELLGFIRDAEIRTNHQALVTLLRALGGPQLDAEALAAILIDAISHYWLLRDVFGGEHPLAVPQQRYLTTLVDMAAHLMGDKQ
ncbi:TetR/AcrR family transcriptional regulator [Nakamurella lactea]|uniref:TetR/AcrR family transcriptional regulator n=1 Tax=Nakamurella lactea TaxID=459515 RepID=UPI0004043347|nr:TetR/AcrR family transcriptional regulator [Nakamurella lactea]